MYKMFVCLFFSGCLIFFPVLVVLADSPETFESITEYGESEHGQDNLPDSQDMPETIYVDNEILPDIADTLMEASTDVSGMDGALETLEETSPAPEESSQGALEEPSPDALEDIPEESSSEALKDEGSLPDEGLLQDETSLPGEESSSTDVLETVPESGENPDTEPEPLAQYYKEYRESLDRLLEYRMEEDSRETEEYSSSASDENLTGSTEDLESLLLFLIFATGMAGGLSASKIMWGRVR